jgi:DNA topoisomerase IA
MRLWIVEKPSCGAALRAAKLIKPEDHVVYTMSLGHWRFQLPDIAFNAIPFTEIPDKTEPLFNYSYGTYMEDGAHVPLVMGEKTSPNTKEFKRLILDRLMITVQNNLEKYTGVILAVGYDRTGMWSAGQILDQLPFEKTPTIFCMHYRTTDRAALEKSYQNCTDNPWIEGGLCKILQNEQRVKKYFDHWWFTNGRLVFGELSNKTGLSQERLLSKYGVMLLMILVQSSNDYTEAEVYRLMTNWCGTGKYINKRVSIGSNVSRALIIESLYECGALIKDGKICKLTSAGRAFVAHLHPRTYDADFPFRLDEWCKTGNIPAVKRYINTVFGRQLRYQRHTA